MSVTIEEVTASSSAVVAGLNHLLPQLSTTAQLLTLVDVERLIDAPGTTVFVARDGDTIVGTLTLVVFDIPSGTRAWIEDVVVDESVRGRGIGEELTRAALELALAKSARSVDLTSRPSRRAANELYQKIGFVARETNVYRFLVEVPEDDSQ